MGIVLCTLEDAPYVERLVDISNYVLFAPIFFASIGLKTDISGLTPENLLFSVCFVVVALMTKIIGCGLAAKVCRFELGDSLEVGVMMTRGEVALIVAQKGLDIGVVDSVYFTAVILLIVVSSVATPLVLKALFMKMPVQPHPSQAKQ
ncbi:cation:proton antiporter [Faecalibacterium hattorii]|uniref:cation:proton antiporter n=1 Tax=Faecalibacterium hattorii TaxID=2935520 RepID=UPI003AB004CF